jgi:hypothetical protein
MGYDLIWLENAHKESKPSHLRHGPALMEIIGKMGMAVGTM